MAMIAPDLLAGFILVLRMATNDEQEQFKEKSAWMKAEQYGCDTSLLENNPLKSRAERPRAQHRAVNTINMLNSSNERKRLNNHDTETSLAGEGGRGTILFGAPFLAAGIFIICRATGIITSGEVNCPLWVLGLVGAMFAMAGCWVMFSGIARVNRNARIRRIQELAPDKPWLADYDWNPNGIRESIRAKIGKPFAMAIFLSVFSAPFNWIGFFSDERPIPFMIGAGLIDLIAVYVVCYALYRFIRLLKYGVCEIRFNTFPFFLGEQIDIELLCPGGIGEFESLEIVLRFVEEVMEASGTGQQRTSQVVCYETYNDTRQMSKSGSFGHGVTALPIKIPLPVSGKPNNLAAAPASYWEVEVSADTAGVDFNSILKLPVYNRKTAL